MRPIASLRCDLVHMLSPHMQTTSVIFQTLVRFFNTIFMADNFESSYESLLKDVAVFKNSTRGAPNSLGSTSFDDFVQLSKKQFSACL